MAAIGTYSGWRSRAPTSISCVSLGPRILILISIGWQFILKFSLAIDWCKRISKLSLDKGNKLKEGHGDLQRERTSGVCKGERKKKGGVCVRLFLVLMCGEVLMERVCVRITHERNLCRKCLWQSLWTFGSISCFSQIHRWICVKIESVLVWKV
jgi:hypothetical protein